MVITMNMKQQEKELLEKIKSNGLDRFVVHNENFAEIPKNSICQTIVILYPNDISRNTIRNEYYAGHQVNNRPFVE